MEETFSVWQFFDDGSSEQVRERVGAEEAVLAAKHYTESVGARLGLVSEVRIVDTMDLCVFQWRRGEGVVWPKQG